MSTLTEFQSAYALGASSSIVSHSINGVEHIQIPPGSTLESMEKLMPAPIRIRSHPAFGDIDSFAAYAKDFQDEKSRVFVDDSAHNFCIVFDGDEKGAPGWGDHSCSMALGLSHEWQRFLRLDGEKMEPKQFAEFIEDHLEYLNNTLNPLSAGELLSMAQTFKLKLKGDLQVDESLHQGLKTLVIKDDSTLRASNSAGNELTFPEELHFNLRIFKNQDTYPIKVYLRYRTSATAVTFFIKIPDPTLLVEQAFDQVMEAVEKATALPTLRGVYDGPRHKR